MRSFLVRCSCLPQQFTSDYLHLLFSAISFTVSGIQDPKLFSLPSVLAWLCSVSPGTHVNSLVWSDGGSVASACPSFYPVFHTERPFWRSLGWHGGLAERAVSPGFPSPVWSFIVSPLRSFLTSTGDQTYLRELQRDLNHGCVCVCVCVCVHHLADENQSTLTSPVFGSLPFPVSLKIPFACIVSSPLTTSLTSLIRLPPLCVTRSEYLLVFWSLPV